MLRIASVVVLVAALQACSLGPDTELTLEVQSSDLPVVAETARVLSARFGEFRPSILSSSKFAIEGSTIRFTFRNAAPEPKIVEISIQPRATSARRSRSTRLASRGSRIATSAT